MLLENKTGSRVKQSTLALILGLVVFPVSFISAPETALSAAYPTTATNQGSITNTRHNLTQSFAISTNPLIPAYMDLGRNNYGEVCVYCHTPHGSNQAEPNLPLWNHTIPDKNSFTLFETAALNGMTSTVTTPGPASLTCLSCHDGTIAIDSVINMPTSPFASGSGYDANSDLTVNISHLDSWPGPGPTGLHMALGTGPGNGCQLCHTPTGIAPDWGLFALGKDLTNDHPIGVVFPAATGPAVDWKEPSDTTADGRIRYFEDAVGGSGSPSTNNNNKLNTNEIRLYDSGDGFEVECASCHDPHGVPSDGSSPFAGSWSTPGLGRTGVMFNNSFLRISNSDSDVCLTCHDK